MVSINYPGCSEKDEMGIETDVIGDHDEYCMNMEDRMNDPLHLINNELIILNYVDHSANQGSLQGRQVYLHLHKFKKS